MRFSIVIPTYQRRQVVTRNVVALERQTCRDFEVIVVVDGSTDGTASALRRLAVRFPLTVLEAENDGAAAARNAGAATAAGEVLLFLDDDMEAHPSLLAEHERSRREGAELVVGDIPLHPASPRNVLSRGVRDWAASRRRRLSDADATLRVDDMITGQMSISRDVFARVGRFDARFTREGMFGGEDLDLGYRLIKAGYRVVFNPRAISYQYYDVSPADFLLRAYESGRSEVELSVKHSEHGRPLGRVRRLDSRLGRWTLGPLVAAPPAFSWPLRAGTVTLVRTRRGGPRLSRLLQAVRVMEHLRGARDARRALSTGRAVVLAYHAIADLRRDPVLREYGVPSGQFAAQLAVLADHGWHLIDLDTLLRALEGEEHLPRRALLLTFDDAYADLLSAALPALRAHETSAVAFAVAAQIGGTNEWDGGIGAEALPLLDADGLRDAASQGVEIGSHTVSHRRLPQLQADELAAELVGSAAQLEALGLPRPRVLAYPHGAWSPEVASAVHEAGYAAAFTVRPAVVERSSPRYALPRVEVYASDTPRKLRLKLAIAGWPERPRRRAARLLRLRI